MNLTVCCLKVLRLGGSFYAADINTITNTKNGTLMWGLLLFSHYVSSDSLWPHGLQHPRLPCPSLSLNVCSDSCPRSLWCYLTISSSATLYSFCLQSFPAWGSFPVNRLFASGCQSTEALASDLPMNIQGWFSFGLTGLISLQSQGLSRVSSSITIQRRELLK